MNAPNLIEQNLDDCIIDNEKVAQEILENSTAPNLTEEKLNGFIRDNEKVDSSYEYVHVVESSFVSIESEGQTESEFSQDSDKTIEYPDEADNFDQQKNSNKTNKSNELCRCCCCLRNNKKKTTENVKHCLMIILLIM